MHVLLTVVARHPPLCLHGAGTQHLSENERRENEGQGEGDEKGR